MSKTLIESLKASLDPILQVRTVLGADLRKVYLVTRTWSGEEIGDGDVLETVVEVTPTPGIRDLSLDYRVQAGGAIQQGDMMVEMISKNRFPDRTVVECRSEDKLTEKYYRLGTEMFRVVKVIEKQLVWNVLVRRAASQEQ